MDVFTRERGVYTFDRFRLDPVRRTLLRDGVVVKLPARLFDTLLYLVANHDRLVERDELMQAVWQGRSVDENSLGQAISALRKTLQAGGTTESFIVTVTGRGYRFGAPVDFTPTPPDSLVAAGQAIDPGSALFSAAGPLPPHKAGWRAQALPFVSIAALCLAASGFAVWRSLGHSGAPPAQRETQFAPPPHSVAVMAFTNLSGDPGQEYFSDGLSEQLIDSLGTVAGLNIAARTSAFSFKGKPATIRDIARALNVAAVMEGSVRRDGATLRIAARLIDSASGYKLWSDHFDIPEGDVFKVQGEIAGAVTKALRINLLGEAAARLTLGGTTNAKALDAYLRSETLAHRRDTGWVRLSLAAADEALAADPHFVQAHVGRAWALRQMAEGFGDDTTDVAYLNGKLKEAMKEAELAVSLAPDMASAHRELGDIAEDMLDFRREGTEVARAMELAPNSVSVIMHYALFQAHLGHAPEAVAAATHAAELDPVSWEVYADLATALDYARQPEKALVAVHHAEQLGIGKDLDTYLTGDIELQQGNAAAARQTCAGGQDWRANLCLALAYHALGQQADADSQLANLRNKVGETGAAVYAGIYAQWGRPDDALHWLEEAYRLQDNGLTTILADWALDPIRGTPRFKDIVRRLNFPP